MSGRSESGPRSIPGTIITLFQSSWRGCRRHFNAFVRRFWHHSWAEIRRARSFIIPPQLVFTKRRTRNVSADCERLSIRRPTTSYSSWAAAFSLASMASRESITDRRRCNDSRPLAWLWKRLTWSKALWRRIPLRSETKSRYVGPFPRCSGIPVCRHDGWVALDPFACGRPPTGGRPAVNSGPTRILCSPAKRSRPAWRESRERPWFPGCTQTN